MEGDFSLLINLKDGNTIFAQDKRYVSPALPHQEECGQYAPEAPYYRCTRAADHELAGVDFPDVHAAHGVYRKGMFAAWVDEENGDGK